MILLAIGVYLFLQLASRLSEGRAGVKFTFKAAPFTHEWELFDWLPRYTATTWDTGDEGQETVRTYKSFAIYGEILFFRWTINGSAFQYEMTRKEVEELQRLAPRVRYDETGEPALTNPDAVPEYHILHKTYTRPKRRVRKKP